MTAVTEWTTKDEGIILIKDMSTSHLENTINMFVRNMGNLRLEILGQAYAFQGTCRGDMACDAIDSTINEIEQMEDEDLLSQEDPTFKALYKEWRSRK